MFSIPAPDIIIMDIMMPVINGVEATKRIKRDFPSTGIIGFSAADREHLIIEMLEAGATGFLIKTANYNEIEKAIKSVFQHVPYYCRQTRELLKKLSSASSFVHKKKVLIPELSATDQKILHLVCEGHSTMEIGDKLNLSKRTIDDYRARILHNTGAKNTAGLVVYAIRNKIYKL